MVDHLETRIPLELLLARDLGRPALRVWCWFDHLCRVEGGPVHVRWSQFEAEAGISFRTGVLASKKLIEAGWLNARAASGKRRANTQNDAVRRVDGSWLVHTTTPDEGDRDTSALPDWVWTHRDLQKPSRYNR